MKRTPRDTSASGHSIERDPIDMTDTKYPRNEMFTRIFQKAAKEFGTSCPVKNELRVRHGRKTQRFVCGNQEIRVVSPEGTEVVHLLAHDTKLHEMRKFFTGMIASMKQSGVCRDLGQ